MNKHTLLWTMLFCCLFVPGTANAALKSSTDLKAVDPVMTYNPKADPGDIVLPMPGGLQCIMRAVAIPAHGALYDKKFLMGLNQTDESRNIYESRVDAFVAAPLRQADLPPSWQKCLPPDEANNFYYYFIGKYEISNAQWHAVMGDTAPEGERPELPKVNISWYDMQAFLHKFNVWLLANHPEGIPSIDNTKSFLRLPTEEEWEFAARGGNRPPEKMNFEDFPLDQDKRVEDYAVFGAGKENPMPIGSKNANPLGIFDMGGNVAELVQSNFQFTIADASARGVVRRMHGSHGGIVSKGGSFLSPGVQDMYPGKRVELPMFASGKNGEASPYVRRDLGMRLVLANLNVAGAKRAKMLEQEYVALTGSLEQKTAAPPAVQEKPTQNVSTGKEAAKQDQLVQLDTAGSPLQELDKIIAAAGSPFMQSNLYQLRDMLKDQNAALERERDTAVLNSIRSAIYKAQAIRNMAFRCWYIMDVAQKIPGQMKAMEKKGVKNIDAEIKKAVNDVYASGNDTLKLLDLAINYYKISIEELSALPLDYVSKKIGILRQEYRGDDAISKLMLGNLDHLKQQLQIAQARGAAAVSSDMVLKDAANERGIKGVKALRERK